MLTQFEVIGYNQQKLYAVSNNVKKPSTIMLLVHGMQEHTQRYAWFADKLAEENILLVASDLRGHGRNMLCGKPGLDNGDIYLNIVEDQRIIVDFLSSEFPDVPVILFGHSYGSFVSQRFVRDGHPGISKIILCGSSYMNTFIVKTARIIAKISKFCNGREADANLIEKLSIRGYGKSFENGNWLTRNEDIFKNYCEDELCGCVFPVAFYESMFTNLPKNYKNVKFVSEILLISGDQDPVCDFSKGIKKLEQVYRKQGIDVALKLYGGARHELLNETNRDEVFADIIKFIKS